MAWLERKLRAVSSPAPAAEDSFAAARVPSPGRREIIRFFLGLLVLAGGFWLVRRALDRYSWEDVLREIKATDPGDAAAVLAFTALSYALLYLYDWLALRGLGKSFSHIRIAVISFVASAFGHTIGFPLLTGGAVRYRFYHRRGLSLGDVGRLLTWTYLTAWLGFTTMAGLAFLGGPNPLPPDLRVSTPWLRAAGALLLLPAAGWLLLGRSRWTLRLRGFHLPPPPVWIASGQIAAGTLKWIIGGMAVFWLLPSDDLSWLGFAGLYSLAQVAAILSHAPGGLGVFDATLMYLLPAEISPPEAAGALLDSA